MFNNSAKNIFFFTLIMSTLITVSANSWFSAWMGLEINLLSFIPLMSDNNLMSNESALKYFLTQALASSILLFSVLILMMTNNLMMKNYNLFINLMMLSALLTKSGAAPFHFWFPNIMEGLNWINSLIIMTWQKIAPLMLISYMMNKMMLTLCAILSIFIGAMGGFNQTSLSKLMAFSSINHLGWVLMSMLISQALWINYFMFYSFLSFNLILMFFMFNLFHANQLFNIFKFNKILKLSFFLNFLSLGGLPPFLGFLPKWITIQYLSMNQNYFILTFMILMTLITLFFYLRMCYSTLLLNSIETNWKYHIPLNNSMLNWYLMLTFISIFGLFMISMIFYFI
nr:NADH dehydrogenase subunit 2 [Domodon peperpotensis]